MMSNAAAIDSTDKDAKIRRLERDLEECRQTLENIKGQAQLGLLTAAVNEANAAIQQKTIIAEYESTINALQQHLVERSQAAALAELKLQQNKEQYDTLQSAFLEASFFERENSQAVEMYRSLVEADEEVLAAASEVEQHLRHTLEEKEQQLVAYQTAFDEFTKRTVAKEKETTGIMKGLQQQVDKLEKLVRQQETLLAPRWLKSAASAPPNGLLLQSRCALLSAASARSRSEFIVNCVPSQTFVQAVTLNDCFTWLLETASTSQLLLEYIRDAHYVDLIAVTRENPAAVAKDRGFVRWLLHFGGLLASLQVQSSCFFEFLRRQSLEKALEILELTALDSAELHRRDGGGSVDGSMPLQMSSPVLATIYNGRVALERLGEMAQSEALSTTTDLIALTAFSTSLGALAAKCGGTNPLMEGLGTDDEDGNSWCVLPTCVNALLHRALALAVNGFTGSGVIKPRTGETEIWESLWQAVSIVLERLPPLNLSIMDVLNRGYDGLRWSHDSKEVALRMFETADDALTSLDRYLCEESYARKVQSLMHVTAKLGPLLQLGSADGTVVVASAVVDGSSTPIAVARDAVLVALCSTEELQRQTEQLRRLVVRREAEIGEVSAKLASLKVEREKERNLVQTLELKLQHALTLAAPAGRLLEAQEKYAKLTTEQMQRLESFRASMKRLEAEGAMLKKRLAEASTLLKSSGEAPKPGGLNGDADMSEVASLKALIKKLDLELYSLHAQSASVLLQPIDLTSFRPSKTAADSHIATTAARLSTQLVAVKRDMLLHLCRISTAKLAAAGSAASSIAGNDGNALVLRTHNALLMRLDELKREIKQLSIRCGHENAVCPRTSAGFIRDAVARPFDRRLSLATPNTAAGCASPAAAATLTIKCAPHIDSLAGRIPLLISSEQLALLQRKMVGGCCS